MTASSEMGRFIQDTQSSRFQLQSSIPWAWRKPPELMEQKFSV
jgi:hypothetical protein